MNGVDTRFSESGGVLRHSQTRVLRNEEHLKHFASTEKAEKMPIVRYLMHSIKNSPIDGGGGGEGIARAFSVSRSNHQCRVLRMIDLVPNPQPFWKLRQCS